MGKSVRESVGSEIKSYAVDKNGNPAWILRNDGTMEFSERFVEQGAIKQKSLKA